MAPRTRGKRRNYKDVLEGEDGSDAIGNARPISPPVAAAFPPAEAIAGRARGRNGKFAKAAVKGDGPATTAKAKPQAAQRALKGHAARKSARPASKGAAKVDGLSTVPVPANDSSDVMDPVRMQIKETSDGHVDEDAYEAISLSVQRLSQAKPSALNGRKELARDIGETEQAEGETTESVGIDFCLGKQLPDGIDAPGGLVNARPDEGEVHEDLINQTINEVLETAELNRVEVFEGILGRSGLLVENEIAQAPVERMEAIDDEPMEQDIVEHSEAQSDGLRTADPNVPASDEIARERHEIGDAQASTSHQPEGRNGLPQPPASGKPNPYNVPGSGDTATKTVPRSLNRSQERRPKRTFFEADYEQPHVVDTPSQTEEHGRKRIQRAEPPLQFHRNASPQYTERQTPPTSKLVSSLRDTATDRLENTSLNEDVLAGQIEEVHAARRVHVAIKSKTIGKMYRLMASKQWTQLDKYWEDSLRAKYSTDRPEGDGNPSSHDAQARTKAVMILWRELVALNEIAEHKVASLVNQRSGSSGPLLPSLNQQLNDLSEHQQTFNQRSRQIKRRIDLICDKELALIDEERLLHRQDLPTRRILVDEIGRLVIPLLVSLLYHAFWLGDEDKTSPSAYFTTTTLKILATIESWLAKLYRTYDGELKARHPEISSQVTASGQRDAKEGSQRQSDSRQAAPEGKQPSEAGTRKKRLPRDDRGMLGLLLREFEISLQAAIQKVEAEVNVFKEAQKRQMREAELAEDKEERARKSNTRFAKLVLDSNKLRRMPDPRAELFAKTFPHRTSSQRVIEEDVSAFPQLRAASSQASREDSAMPSWAHPLHATGTSARCASFDDAIEQFQPTPLGQRPSSRPSASPNVQRLEQLALAGIDSDGHFDGDGDGAEEYYSAGEDAHDRTKGFPAQESEPLPSIEEASDDSETPESFQPWTVDMQRRFLDELRKAQNPDEVEEATRSIATAFSRPWGDTVEQRRMLQISCRDLCRRRGLEVEPWARKTKPQL